jgi:hypothetical protein
LTPVDRPPPPPEPPFLPILSSLPLPPNPPPVDVVDTLFHVSDVEIDELVPEELIAPPAPIMIAYVTG